MPNNNWDTSLYEQKHAFVYEYRKGLIPVLQPQPGELILDLGCGTGHLTHTIAESGAHVIGIDSSAKVNLLTNPHYRHFALALSVPEKRNPTLLSPPVLYRQFDPQHHERQP
jgi:precorrin-6B methylase 2